MSKKKNVQPEEEVKQPTDPQEEAKVEEQTEAGTDTEEAQETKAEETEKKEDQGSKDKEALEALQGKMIRLQADFDNYKKRTQKEKADTFAFAQETLMTKLLPVIDNLERAEKAGDNGNVDSYREGVEMVFKELMNVLGGEGLKEIEAQGKPFDPNFHHGVAVGDDGEKEDQEILEVFQKGYQFKDKVIRAAMVKVNQQ